MIPKLGRRPAKNIDGGQIHSVCEEDVVLREIGLLATGKRFRLEGNIHLQRPSPSRNARCPECKQLEIKGMRA
jgi:hypothetical protein